MSKGLRLTFDDAWLLGGARTPFVDYRGALAEISPIDLGIKAARAAIERTGVKAADIGHTIAGSMAQASFDAYVTPRHIGLYAGAPIEAPAHLVQRICGTGIEVIAQAADSVSLGRVDLALAAGCESMSRNSVLSPLGTSLKAMPEAGRPTWPASSTGQVVVEAKGAVSVEP